MHWAATIVIPYSIVILFGWYYLKKRRPEELAQSFSSSDQSLPTVSIIVAARNEENNLPLLISDLKELVYPDGKLQVVIVDDNSIDGTPDILMRSALTSSLITSIRSSGSGKKAAIKTGLQYSDGELIMTTDADCRVNPSWVRSFAECYLESSAGLIIGQVKPTGTKGALKRMVDLEFLSLQAITGGMAMAGRPVMCNGANLAFRRSVANDYSRITRSDISSGDDMFMLHHVKSIKEKIVWLKDKRSVVSTLLPETLNQFIKQRGRWARKSTFYNDRDTIIIGLATMLTNISIVVVALLLPFYPSVWVLLPIIMAGKGIPEFILLNEYLKGSNSRSLLAWFLPVSIIYPLYVLIALIGGLFSSNKW